MKIQLLRHATLRVEVEGRAILVDPMFAPAEAWDPVQNAPNPRRNPMVELPIPAEEILDGIAGVLVTHLHGDHWDSHAVERIPKHLPVFCQPQDQAKIVDAGFENAQGVEDRISWESIELHRTDGRHGRGEIAQRMGQVSGFVLQGALYIAGDTVWCSEVERAVKRHQPGLIIVNAGAAQFHEGGPITMPAEDVAAVCRAAPGATVVAVHMEAINHCRLTRGALRDYAGLHALDGQLLIPEDGEILDLR